MKANGIAMVIGNTIHLHNTTRQQFLSNQRWLRHEIAHVHQWLKLGKALFLFKYLIESFRKGYYNNRFEVEARMSEHDVNILNDVTIV
jgi:hypothetical protein